MRFDPIWLLLILAGAFLACLAFISPPANAHSFYSGECCHDKDCSPRPDGSVRITPEGYEWNLNGEVQLFKWQDHRIRYSPDGKYHGCVLSTGTRRCLYVPPQGS